MLRPRQAWRRVAAACLVLAVGPCQSIALVFECPPVIEYSLAEQRQAAAELRAAPANSMLARFAADYGTTRKALRACAGGQS